MKYLLTLLAVVIFFASSSVMAKEPKVDYGNEVIIDSDLDGVTDQAETQVYFTDSKKPDTDGDGILDGVEILKGTDPLDANNPSVFSAETNNETPWVWYIARASGLLGYIFLWITIFLGLSIRNSLLKKIIEPIYSFDFHCFMGASVVFWSLIHGTSLLFDKTVGFGIRDVAIPFFSSTTLVNVNYLALGIMAFYAMVIMTITSYLRSHIRHWLWRILHFLNPLAFIFVVAHGYMIGTDTKNFYIGSAYLFSSFILVLVYLSSLLFVLWNKFKAPSAEEILKKDI